MYVMKKDMRWSDEHRRNFKKSIEIRRREGKHIGKPFLLTPEEFFVEGVMRHSAGLRPYFLKFGSKPYECEQCHVGPEWRGKPLVIELDHINGDRLDNRLENLRWLCPNCHSQTHSFRKPKSRRKSNACEG
jgi:predicted RNA-binding Zn-ribbon protein involved in translation (DUF1610 family)